MKIGKYIYVAVVLGILCMVYLAIFGVGPIKGVADIRFGIDIRGGVEAIFQPRDYAEKPTVADLDAARVIIEGRLDAMNILDREVTVDQGGGYILVRFPWKSGETEFNPEAAISELGEMAKLTFRDEKGQVLLEGKNVVASHASVDQNGFPAVSLEFDSIGNRLFGEATAANVGRVISIYMDETLLSAANVDEAIYGGKAIITGKFTAEYTKSLAEKINSGALPFALETKSFSTISPSLAQESLRVMVAAGLLSLLCICLFMCCRYKLAGVVSFLALLLQISVQLLTVSMSQLTLTLPGIAGIILSIGMGVDANIIISERIGDELREKTTIRLAIKTGYKNAFHAVFDGNITTMIVAVLLIIFGSSTMLSFGYTLGIGLVMNFVAGVAATHIMLNSLIQNKTFNQIKLFRVAKKPKVRGFYGKRKLAYGISGIVIIAGVIFACVGGVALDTQFKGGVVLKYSYQQALDPEAVEKLAAQEFAVPATVQLADDISGGGHKLVVTLAQDQGITPQQQQQWMKTLNAAYPQAGLALVESFAVEPYIGAQARTNGMIAIGLASLMIVLYIWLRFQRISGLSAGVMALVALIHDAFVVFAAFVLAGFPIGDSFVAVVLTIIGYSINDTIVIYDRIRENKQLNPRLPIPALVDLSISQSFTRSVYTSLTTLAAVAFMIAFALWYGLSSILYFAVPMAFGLISGCYSTICIAGPLWTSWQLRRMKA